jgi:addiction module RelB/DinJ family antitoxin
MSVKDDRVAISLTVDKGVKERALKVLCAQGITMSGALKAMVRVGIRQERMPFEVTREPEVAGIGMSDEDAKCYGIPKDGTDGRSGITCGITIKMPPEDKKVMREWCRSLCIMPNAMAHLYLGQIAFELRIPLNN